MHVMVSKNDAETVGKQEGRHASHAKVNITREGVWGGH